MSQEDSTNTQFRQIPVIPLSEDKEVTWTDNVGEARIKRLDVYHEDPKDPLNLILVRELVQTYTQKGLILEEETVHSYSENYKRVETVSTTSRLVKLPEQDDEKLIPVNRKVVSISERIDQ